MEVDCAKVVVLTNPFRDYGRASVPGGQEGVNLLTVEEQGSAELVSVPANEPN